MNTKLVTLLGRTLSAALGCAFAAGCGGATTSNEEIGSTSLAQESDDEGEGPVVSVQHQVPHVSTVPANAGEAVHLSVRERVREGETGGKKVVLFLEGSATPVAPAFDLDYKDYNWMSYLAASGFDAFALDLTGYGSSPRPKMDDPCNVTPSQQVSLIPNPLPAPCAASYPKRLSTSQSEWDEIDTVVDYLRNLKKVDKISIVGWSAGSQRATGYAVRHQDKVETLVLYAPVYNPTLSTNPPAVVPAVGNPTGISTRTSFAAGWDSQVGCPGQFEPEIRDAVWAADLATDPVGSSWGAGVLRFPQITTWGVNQSIVQTLKIPTLVIGGTLDRNVPPATQKAFFAALGAEDKLHIEVSCASHFMLWETQHGVLHRASRDWLRHHSVHGSKKGYLAVDANGEFVKDKTN